jgi:hypothetical protein
MFLRYWNGGDITNTLFLWEIMLFRHRRCRGYGEIVLWNAKAQLG